MVPGCWYHGLGPVSGDMMRRDVRPVRIPQRSSACWDPVGEHSNYAERRIASVQTSLLVHDLIVIHVLFRFMCVRHEPVYNRECGAGRVRRAGR